MRRQGFSFPHLHGEIHAETSNTRANQSTCGMSCARAKNGQCPSSGRRTRTFYVRRGTPRAPGLQLRWDLLKDGHRPNKLSWSNVGKEAQVKIYLFPGAGVAELR